MGSIRSVGFGVALATLAACSGNAFEQGNAGGSDIAGAAGDAGAASIGAAGASMLGGSTAAGAGKGGSGSSGGTSGDAGEAGEGGSGSLPMLVKCSREGWKASAFASYADKYGGPAELVLDGDDATRWSSGTAQEPGQWFQIDVQPGVLSLELRSTMFAGDLPSKLGLELDGKAAGTTVAKSEASVRLTAPGLELAKQIRILVVDAGAPWWSIGELDGWCGR